MKRGWEADAARIEGWMQMGPGVDYPFRSELYPRFVLK